MSYPEELNGTFSIISMHKGLWYILVSLLVLCSFFLKNSFKMQNVKGFIMTKEQIYDKVSSIIIDYLRLEQGELKPESHIVNDLGADSLALVELGFKFSEAFNIGMINPDESSMIISNLIDRIFNEVKK